MYNFLLNQEDCTFTPFRRETSKIPHSNKLDQVCFPAMSPSASDAGVQGRIKEHVYETLPLVIVHRGETVFFWGVSRCDCSFDQLLSPWGTSTSTTMPSLRWPRTAVMFFLLWPPHHFRHLSSCGPNTICKSCLVDILFITSYTIEIDVLDFYLHEFTYDSQSW